MPKHTRRAARKGTRKVRHSRRHGTRRMKRGGGLFTRNSAVAPRRNAPYREGSVAYNTAKKAYNANKAKISEVVDRLTEAVKKVWQPVLDKYGSVEQMKKKITKDEFKDIMMSKVSINKEGTKQARDAIENYLKISAKVKKPMLEKMLAKMTSYSKPTRDVMEFMGISNESVGSLFDHIDNDTLTVAKAAVLIALIEKHDGLMKKAESGNISQTGGAEEFAKATILTALFPIAIAFAAPSYGGSVIIFLILAFMIMAAD